MTTPPIQFIAPLPPLKTGIAQYTEDLLNAVDGRWDVKVFGEPGSREFRGVSVCSAGGRGSPDPSRPTVVQVGNSANHPRAYDLAGRLDGVLVLHDVVLHHARLGEYIARGKTREYLAELRRWYGPEGDRLGREILAGRSPQDLLEFPMFEPFVERARLTIVHSEFARENVLARVPDARVVRALMGIPLPALVEQMEARRALGLAKSAFIVASITHINPMKRLPAVLRAFRQVAVQVPDAMLVIAGSPSPQVNLELLIQILGLEGRVLLLGYIPDRDARLLARASDACVNLRYPGTGETSASLLRLLGAGRPVLVTEGVASSELPDDVGLRVPVDRFEEEMIAELLTELAKDTAFRQEAGRLARQFIEQQHSIGQAVDGYRAAIQEAYGIDLPPAADPLCAEPAPRMGVAPVAVVENRRSSLDQQVAGALMDLGLDRNPAAIERVADVMVELGLNRLVPHLPAQTKATRLAPQLLSRLTCAVCGGSLERQTGAVVCGSCGASFTVRNGVVDLTDTQAVE